MTSKARKIRFTLLGTGSSGGVPRIGNDWGVCDPAEPRNRRSRCGAMVELLPETGTGEPTRILIDTSADLREQMLSAKVGRIDGVIFTHDHADQTGGIDDLRIFAIRQRARIPVYMDKATAETLTSRVQYCFQGAGDYPSVLDLQPIIAPGNIVSLSGPSGEIEIMPLQQEHGTIGSLGFRIGNLAYCNDLNALPPETMKALEGIDIFIIDALRYTPHPSHANVDQALAWSRALKARRTILTNMHIDLDYQTLCKTLPPGVEPAYDGLIIEHQL